jgi:transcription elongation factor GreA
MDYVTADEKSRLETELRERIDQRKVISTRIEEARALGDLKENAEYHAAREDQGLNEAKIRELESRIAKAIVTDTATLPEGMVFLGATVRLRDTENGSEMTYRLVGELGGGIDDDIIEVTPNSPLGEALMKSTVGEVVKVDLRRGPRRFEIVDVES